MKKYVVIMFLITSILFVWCDTNTVCKEPNSRAQIESVDVILNNFLVIRKTSIKRLSRWDKDHYLYESYKLEYATYSPFQSHLSKHREKQIKRLLAQMRENNIIKLKKYVLRIQDLNNRYEYFKNDFDLSTQTIELIRENQISLNQLITLAKNNIGELRI